MSETLKSEILNLIKLQGLNCTLEEFKKKVDWYWISIYQKLSEEVIREFKDKVNWYWISKYQKLSEDFIREFNLKIDTDNWLYWTDKQKIRVIKRYYDIDNEGFIVAWKGIRSDRYSNYNFQFKYEKGQIYEAHCDCTAEENSFGLSAWTKEKASEYCNELVVRVKIHVSDIGRIVHNGGKIRCFKQTFLD